MIALFDSFSLILEVISGSVIYAPLNMLDGFIILLITGYYTRSRCIQYTNWTYEVNFNLINYWNAVPYISIENVWLKNMLMNSDIYNWFTQFINYFLSIISNSELNRFLCSKWFKKVNFSNVCSEKHLAYYGVIV